VRSNDARSRRRITERTSKRNNHRRRGTRQTPSFPQTVAESATADPCAKGRTHRTVGQARRERTGGHKERKELPRRAEVSRETQQLRTTTRQEAKESSTTCTRFVEEHQPQARSNKRLHAAASRQATRRKRNKSTTNKTRPKLQTPPTSSNKASVARRCWPKPDGSSFARKTARERLAPLLTIVGASRCLTEGQR